MVTLRRPLLPAWQFEAGYTYRNNPATDCGLLTSVTASVRVVSDEGLLWTIFSPVLDGACGAAFLLDLPSQSERPVCPATSRASQPAKDALVIEAKRNCRCSTRAIATAAAASSCARRGFKLSWSRTHRLWLGGPAVRDRWSSSSNSVNTCNPPSSRNCCRGNPEQISSQGDGINRRHASMRAGHRE